MPQNANGSPMQPGCIPNENGWNSGRPPRSYRHTRWYNYLWQRWGGTRQEHDRIHGQSSPERTQRLNSKKCHIKQKSVSFFGVTFGEDGMSPDPKKIQGIVDMPSPWDTTQLQSFLGMVNFMHPFIPHLSANTQTTSCQECNFPMDTFYGTSFPETQGPDNRSTKQKSQVLWQEQAYNSTSRCQQRWFRSSTPPRQSPNSIRIQITVRCWENICKHWAWTTCSSLCMWTIPHLSTRKRVHHWKWPQAPGDDGIEELDGSTPKTLKDATSTTTIRLHN